jgi:hypothetical protein
MFFTGLSLSAPLLSDYSCAAKSRLLYEASTDLTDSRGQAGDRGRQGSVQNLMCHAGSTVLRIGPAG